MNHLKGKTALITGGTIEIGIAIAMNLSGRGAHVVVITFPKARHNNDQQPFITAGYSRPESAKAIAREILNTYGSVNNTENHVAAYLTSNGGYSKLEKDEWNNEFQLNLKSSVSIKKDFLPTRIENEIGVIINISMNPANQPMWNMTIAFSALRVALSTYTKALSIELGSKGLRVDTGCPDLVTLQMEGMDKMTKSSQSKIEEAIKSIIDKLGNVPFEKMAEPEEIANLVEFLLPPQEQYFTGEIYQIDDGGFAKV